MEQTSQETKLAVKTALLDTGPLVAYLDASDSQHDAIATVLGQFAGTLCTTSAVITEAMHLLKSDTNGPRSLAEFVQAAAVQVFESTQPQQLFAAANLMERYSDSPMDFADATLVLLASEIDVPRIFTLDRRGFGIFRTRKGKPFEIFPKG